jgi:putative ABC transport system ATP-binding protein
VTGAPIIELAEVRKTFRAGGARGAEFRALNGVDLLVTAGEMVAITGPSGSGKTTIINLIAGIDRPTAGTVTVGGSRLDQMNEEQLAVWRGRTIGIVFQFFQLMPTLTAAENAALPLDLARRGPARERKDVSSRHLAAVGLGDEPTGNLDSAMTQDMFRLLKELNDGWTTVVYVTHDQGLAARAGRTVSVRDGQIVADTGAPLIREEP